MLKTFRKGGIHPPENKLSSGSEIRFLGIPERVSIPVSQHAGSPATLIVKKGDHVKTGQLIAESCGFVSANIHSSVSGTVSAIDTIPDASGYRQTAVVIDTEGDEWVASADLTNVINKEIRASSDEIIKLCRESGLVGMGGAAFPLHVKLTIPEGKRCNLLIINGVECEPYLTADHRIMIEKGEQVLVGISIIMKALGVEKAMIGIENNKQNAIRHLTDLATGFHGITVHPLKVKYPQGAEKQLIKSLINREVPAGRLPVDIGVMVQNVATAFAVYEAVQKNKPLIERVVTISGKSVSRPGNYLVRIGTSVKKLIDAAGGIPDNNGKIISGGPMMGKALNSTEVPVVKGTSGIILLDAGESRRLNAGRCIRCAKCVSVCALGLEPYLLTMLSEQNMFERAEQEGITGCMECGSCSYICPANRPLLDYIRLGKAKVNRAVRERSESKTS